MAAMNPEDVLQIVESFERDVGCPDIDAFITSRKRKNTVKNLKTTCERLQAAFAKMSNLKLVSSADDKLVLETPTIDTLIRVLEHSLRRLVESCAKCPPRPMNSMLTDFIPNMMGARNLQELLDQPITMQAPVKQTLVQVARQLFALTGHWIPTCGSRKAQLRQRISDAVQREVDRALPVSPPATDGNTSVVEGTSHAELAANAASDTSSDVDSDSLDDEVYSTTSSRQAAAESAAAKSDRRNGGNPGTASDAKSNSVGSPHNSVSVADSIARPTTHDPLRDHPPRKSTRVSADARQSAASSPTRSSAPTEATAPSKRSNARSAEAAHTLSEGHRAAAASTLPANPTTSKRRKLDAKSSSVGNKEECKKEPTLGPEYRQQKEAQSAAEPQDLGCDLPFCLRALVRMGHGIDVVRRALAESDDDVDEALQLALKWHHEEMMRKQEEANNRALDEMQVVSEIETRKIAEQKEADEETKLLNMAILRSPFAETSIVLRANESSSPRTAAKSSSDSAASTTLRSLLEAEINLFEKDEVDECTAPLMELHTTCIRFLKLEREALTWYKDIARHHFSKLAVKIQNSITAATHSCANRADLYCKVARVFSEHGSTLERQLFGLDQSDAVGGAPRDFMEGYAKVHDADVEFVGLTLGDNDAPDYVVDLANE